MTGEEEAVIAATIRLSPPSSLDGDEELTPTNLDTLRSGVRTAALVREEEEEEEEEEVEDFTCASSSSFALYPPPPSTVVVVIICDSGGLFVICDKSKRS